MFWLVLLVVIAAAISVGMTSHVSDSEELLTLRKRLHRADPASPLKKLGPEEFEVAYEKAAQKKSDIHRALKRRTRPIIFIGTMAGGIASALIFGTEDQDILKGFLLILSGLGLANIWVFKLERKHLPDLLDIMREQVSAWPENPAGTSPAPSATAVEPVEPPTG